MHTNGTVKIGSTDMYYVSFGSGPRKMVVLPGLSDGLATVKGKALLLSVPFRKFLREYTVFVFSRKNQMPEGYTIRDMARDQVLAMETLRIGKADLLGVSQGGMIAQYIAAEHPEAVSRHILTVTAPYANDVIQENASDWIRMAERGDHLALMVDTAERMYSETYLRRNRWLYPLTARFTKPKSYERFLRNAEAILSFDARSVLPQIQCPTLIIGGADDHTVGREAADVLHRGIPGSELFVYPGLGHGAFEEAKDFYDRVLAFCDRQS